MEAGPEQHKTALFELKQPFDDPFRRALFAVMKRPLARLLCLKKINTLYEVVRDMDSTGSFIDRVLDLMNVDVHLTEEMIRNIPTKGPCVLVANHPFGIIDGLVLLKAMRAARPDSLVLANHMLALVPEMREFMIQVDPFGTTESTAKNISGLKAALRWLKGGHMLGVFPAGEVASLQVKRRMVRDPAWSPTVAGIVRRAKCPVVPLFIKGRHGALFNALGLVHPRLRTVMIPRMNLKQGNRAVDVRIGHTVPAKKIASLGSDQEIIDYLRFRTYVLRKFEQRRRAGEPAEERPSRPIAAPWPREEVLAEIAALPEERILVRSKPFIVFESGVSGRPGLLHEIGRLREETFRPVGEGTGMEIDTDRFDLTYRHLVLWDEVNQRLAGAYRFGKTDEIVARQGVKGLYSSTLFKFRPELFEHISPAMEMGRSFVCKDYQKSYQPLLLLWRAIGEYVARNPHYTKLFGCVSVSSDYSAVSREVIVEFMRKHSSLPALAHLVKPKRPPKLKYMKRLDTMLPEAAFGDPEELPSVVGDIEVDKSIPVLLKQYLKLGGKILAFNMDPDFGDCMDGLIVVDLLHTDPKLLARFMGPEKADAFLAHHHQPLENNSHHPDEPDKAA
jgi:putative hemolysin